MPIIARLAGVGMYVPPRIVDNRELEPLLDTSDEWVRQRTGIESRRWVAAGTATSELALEAARAALGAADLRADQLDLIIFATQTPDHQVPGSSAILQHALGLSVTPAMDIRTQCTGFLYSLHLAKALIESGQHQRILIVGAEVQSPLLDWTPRGRDFSVLFGDGAGAAVLEAAPGPGGCGRFLLRAQGEFAHRLCHKKPGTGSGGAWVTAEDIEEGRIYPFMDGRVVFKHAVERMNQIIPEVLECNHLAVGDIQHFVLHQANLRINERVAENLQLPPERVYSNIQKYGNCSAASIPMLLSEKIADGTIKRGDRMLLAAFGAGFTWGAGVIQF